MTLPLRVAAALLAMAGPLRAQQAAECRLRVHGDVPADTVLSRAQLAALQGTTLRAADHGKDSVGYAVVPLAEVLRAVGAPLGPAPRGGGLARYVVARAADGYRTVYSAAEADTLVTAGGVWLAYAREGGALSAEEGPCRMLVPGDRKHARWVRQVTSLEVRSVP